MPHALLSNGVIQAVHRLQFSCREYVLRWHTISLVQHAWLVLRLYI